MGSVGAAKGNTGNINTKKILEQAQKTEIKLKNWFKRKGDIGTLIYDKEPNSEGPGLHRRFRVEKEGRRISVFSQIVSDSNPNMTFGGGYTMARGYFEVAQVMNNIASWGKWRKNNG